MISDETGTKATVIKLMRVALLAVVVAGVAIAYRQRGRESAKNVPWLPWFLCLFLLLAAAKSAGFIGAVTAQPIDRASQTLMTIAIVALGVKTSLAGVLQCGWRPHFLLAAKTVWVAGIALIGACATAVA